MSHTALESTINCQKRGQHDEAVKREVSIEPCSLPLSGFWNCVIAWFFQCVGANHCIDLETLPPICGEDTCICDPPRPQSQMIMRPGSQMTLRPPPPTSRAASSCVSIRSADIRKRGGRWMVSHDIGSGESIFIQFPPFSEDEFQSHIEEAIEAESGNTRMAVNKKTSEKHGRDKMINCENWDPTTGGSLSIKTTTESDELKEWFPL